MKADQRAVAVALLVLALAFALRLGVLDQRASSEGLAWQPLPGSDELTYYNQARDWAAGLPRETPFYHHPGVMAVLAAFMRLLGDDLWRARLGFILLDTLTTAAVMLCAALAARRAAAAWLAGALYAVYPVAAFYSTTFWDSTLSAFLVGWLAALTLWQAQGLRWWRTLALGALCGLLVVTRQNLAPLALVPLAVIALAAGAWRQKLAQCGALALAAALVVAPFTLHNYLASGGQIIPVATTGGVELYMGLNRDSAGLHGHNAATDTLNTAPLAGLLRDLWLDAPRMLGLAALKTVRFFGAGEIGNSYAYDDVRAQTPLLGIPLSHAGLCALGFLGWLLLWRHNRRAAWVLAAFVGLCMLSHTLTFTFSRIRFPVTPLLAAAAGGLALLAEARLRRPTWRSAAAGALGLAVISTPWWVQPEMLVRERTHNALPADAVPLGILFEDSIELVGWRAFPGMWDAPVQQWGEAGDAYAVELFWRLPRPLTEDLAFYIAYVQDGQRVLSFDQQLGNVSYPPAPTSGWAAGTLYSEIVGFRLRPGDQPPRTGDIRVGVYRELATGEIQRLRPRLSGDATDVLLQAFALYPQAGTPAAPGMPLRVFYGPGGQAVALLSATYPAAAAPGAEAVFTFEWEALTDVREDLTLFIHLMNEDGSPGVVVDVPPAADLTTATWRPGWTLRSQISVALPQTPQRYEVFMGLRDVNSGERWQADAPDNRPYLGTLAAEG
jgi:4-amino-4-deoxy-L-arabinose transferase-like glycosyltransferase